MDEENTSDINFLFKNNLNKMGFLILTKKMILLRKIKRKRIAFNCNPGDAY
jgi:hypothetical protein